MQPLTQQSSLRKSYSAKNETLGSVTLPGNLISIAWCRQLKYKGVDSYTQKKTIEFCVN